jgi:hypothetical protein
VWSAFTGSVHVGPVRQQEIQIRGCRVYGGMYGKSITVRIPAVYVILSSIGGTDHHRLTLPLSLE